MKKAFTLAEVLITLMIIGIVAALTIPSVISNYQQQEFKTGLKKAVSVLNEAIQMNISQDGETPYENYNLFYYLQRHMNVLKRDSYSSWSIPRYGTNPVNRALWSGYASSDQNRIFYTVDGMRFETYVNIPSGHDLILHESNTSVLRRGYYSGWGTGKCGSYGLLNNPHKTTESPCLITVDVNGDKSPNPKKEVYMGKEYGIYSFPSPSDKKLSDMFTIMITDEKAIPFGVVAQRAMYSK